MKPEDSRRTSSNIKWQMTEKKTGRGDRPWLAESLRRTSTEKLSVRNVVRDHFCRNGNDTRHYVLLLILISTLLWSLQLNLSLWPALNLIHNLITWNGRCFKPSKKKTACSCSWASERGCRGSLDPLDFENFSKKGCFLSFEWEKTNFTSFGLH